MDELMDGQEFTVTHRLEKMGIVYNDEADLDAVGVEIKCTIEE